MQQDKKYKQLEEAILKATDLLIEKAKSQGCINKVKNKDFPTSLQTLRILIHTEDVEILGPRFGHLLTSYI